MIVYKHNKLMQSYQSSNNDLSTNNNNNNKKQQLTKSNVKFLESLGLKVNGGSDATPSKKKNSKKRKLED